jgi:hypothetical protein
MQLRPTAWPDHPAPPIGSTTTITIVASTKPRDTAVQLPGSDATPIKLRLRRSHEYAGVLTVPVLDNWGTHFALVQAPPLALAPTPVAQRAGSTLWFSPEPFPSRIGHSVEWVEPGRWYLIGSHVTTERVWWDVVSWGDGAGGTVDSPIHEALPDIGCSLLATREPLTIAAIMLVNRTFAHDDVVALADARELPFDPAYHWVPRKVDGNLHLVDKTSPSAQRAHDPRGVIPVLGALKPSPSWDATPARPSKRAAALHPIEQHTWNADLPVGGGQTVVHIGRSGAGFVVSGEEEPMTADTPMVSLFDTPYPEDDPEPVM